MGRWEWHHVKPMFMGGARNGELRLLPAEYHQLITNAFRARVPYGQGRNLPTEEVQRILTEVYDNYPVNNFPRY